MWRMKISFYSWPVLHAGKQTTKNWCQKQKDQHSKLSSPCQFTWMGKNKLKSRFFLISIEKEKRWHRHTHTHTRGHRHSSKTGQMQVVYSRRLYLSEMKRVVGWSCQRRLSCLDGKMFGRTSPLSPPPPPVPTVPPLYSCQSLKSLFSLSSLFSFYFLSVSIFSPLATLVGLWVVANGRGREPADSKGKKRQLTGWMQLLKRNGQMKRERRREKKERKKKKKKVVRKKNLGKCSGLVVVIGRRLFLFSLWAEPEQSLQLNHTDGISSKGILFFF